MKNNWNNLEIKLDFPSSLTKELLKDNIDKF